MKIKKKKKALQSQKQEVELTFFTSRPEDSSTCFCSCEEDKERKEQKHNNLEEGIEGVGRVRGGWRGASGDERAVGARVWDLLPSLLFAFVLSGLQHLLLPQTEEVRWVSVEL